MNTQKNNMFQSWWCAFVKFLSKPFFSDYRTTFWLWIILALLASIFKFNRCNNFLVYQSSFWHIIQGRSIYGHFPTEFHDMNHYGPLFGFLFAPFSLLIHPLGLFSWFVVMTVVLWFAIRTLPVPKRNHIFIYWFCAHELLTALFMAQFNIVVAAIIVASFTCIIKKKDIWATLFILIGTFVKLYGIVGLAFFFFSKRKKVFIISFIGWAIVLYMLPMLISSPEYINTSYIEWFYDIIDKNGTNIFSPAQNISLLGMIRKISGVASYSDLWFIAIGLIIFAIPYLRVKQYKNAAFRYAFLASVMLFVVLFSTGSESSSYIIALIGVCIWYLTSPWKRTRWDIGLMVFAFIITSLSPSDLFPQFLKQQIIQPYALKSLPCVIIWLKLSYEMCFKDYSQEKEMSQIA